MPEMTARLDEKSMADYVRLTKDMQSVRTLSEQLSMQLRGEPTNTMNPSNGADPRMFPSHTPHILIDGYSINQPDGVARYKQFYEDYISMDATRRKPHLDHIFDVLENTTFDYDISDPQQICDNAAHFIALLQRATYSDGVVKENTDYLDERYHNDPMGRYKLQNMQEMLVLAAPLLSHTLLQYGFGINAPVDMVNPYTPEQVDQLYGKPENISIPIKALQQEHANYINMMEGKPLRPIEVPAPELNGLNPCNITRLLSDKQDFKAVLKTSRRLFEQTFDSIFGERRSVDTAKTKLIDRIFIDGKSASELYGEKHKDLPPDQRDSAIATSIMEAMGSGRNRIDIATVHPDANGKPTVMVQPLKMDLTAVQPSIKSEYGWFRRTLLNWGPTKCKTRQERQDELYAKDPEREERLQAIGSKLQETVNTKAIERDAVATATAIQATLDNVHRHKQMDLITQIGIQDEAYFSSAGATKDERNLAFSSYSGQMKTMPRNATRVSIATMMMLNNGYSMHDIVTDYSDEMQQARAKNGKDMIDMLDRNDTQELADFYIKAGNKLLEQKIPNVDLSSIGVIAPHLNELTALAVVCKDYEQTMLPHVMEAIKETISEKEFAAISNGNTIASHALDAVSSFASFYTADTKAVEKGTVDDGIIASAMGGKKFLEVMGNNLRGKSIAQIEQTCDLSSLLSTKQELTSSAMMAMAENPQLLKPATDYLLEKNPMPMVRIKDGYRVHGTVVLGTLQDKPLVNNDLSSASKEVSKEAAPQRARVDRKELEAQERGPARQRATNQTQPSKTTEKVKEKGAEVH